jgi:hypothetical protein
MPRVFFVTFQKHKGRRDRLAKFIVIATGTADAIKEAWESATLNLRPNTAGPPVSALR